MLWLLENPETVCFDELRPQLPLLSEVRRVRVLSMKQEAPRVQSVLAELLLRHALRQEYGMTRLPKIETGKKGKPFFPDHPALHFNLSHCKYAVACALDGAPVGVDAEALGRLLRDGAQPVSGTGEQGSGDKKTSPACREGGEPSGAAEGPLRRQNPSGMDAHRPPPPSEALLLRVLSETEREWVLAGQSPAEQDRRFTAVWTCKEAWGKARGLGFLYDLNSTCFLPDKGTWKQYDTFFRHFSREKYELTLCSRDPLLCKSIRFEEIQYDVSE